MFEPVGPLPASVYWRRRWAALAAVVTGVVVLIWCVIALTGAVQAGRTARLADVSSSSQDSALQSTSPAPDAAAPNSAAPNAAAASSASAAPSTPASAGPAASAAPASGPPASGAPASGGAPPSSVPLASSTVPGSVVASRAIAATHPAGSPSGAAPASGIPAGQAGASPAAAGPAPVSIAPTVGPTPGEQLAPVAPAAAAPPAAAPPAACPDQVVSVTAEAGQPSYRIGQQPVLRLVITNTGPTACLRDLDPGLQEIVVWTPDRTGRLWSSNDCSPVHRPDVRTLPPGQRLVFTVNWAGRTSQPDCAGVRKAVPAGNYTVLVRLGALISAGVPLTLTP